MKKKKLYTLWLAAMLLGVIRMPVPSCAFTLDECVDLALKNNPDIQKQLLNTNIAAEDLSEQKSSNFGNLSIVSSYTHYNLSRTLTPLTPASIATDPAGVPTTQDLFAAGIVYELPLFTGFARTRAVEIANLQKKMAASGLKLSSEQLIYNVKTLYVNILSQQAREKAQGTYVAALQRLYQDISRELKLGQKAHIDQLKADADLKSGQAELLRIGSDIRVLKAGLASLLNIPEIPAVEDIASSPEKIVAQTDAYFGKFGGLERLKAAALEMEKNKKLALKARSVLYPQVVLNTSYGQNFGPNDDSHVNSGDWENQEVWQAGLNLKWSIFDFGANRAKIRKATLLERQSRYEKTKIELELRRSVVEAVTRINTAVSDYESARDEYALTRKTESIEQVRYDQGVADINDLLYAKGRNQLAHSRFISAGYGYVSARFYLDYLLEQGEKNRGDVLPSSSASVSVR